MTTQNVEVLFQPFRLKSLQLKNRIVIAPMTRSRSPEGVPGENVAAYYRRRAEAEVGLIVSEGTVIDRPASRNEPAIPFFHGNAALTGLEARHRGSPRSEWQNGASAMACGFTA